MATRKKTQDTPKGFLPHGFGPISYHVGIDPSLSSTGVCVLDSVGNLIDSLTVGSGDDVAIELSSDPVKRLAGFFDFFSTYRFLHGAVVAIEGYSMGSPFKREALGELGGVIRLALARREIPTVCVAPQSLRKFILPDSDKGGKGKERTILAVYKRWGVEFPTSDQCDAYALARLVELRTSLTPGFVCLTDSTRRATDRMKEAATKAAVAIPGVVSSVVPVNQPARRRVGASK